MSRGAPGVVRPVARKDPPAAVTSRQLKFGVDRILSPEICPRARAAPVSSTDAWHCLPPADHGATSAADVPCSQCVSSLLRCCRITPPVLCESSCYAGFYSTLHSPRPVRPFTNLLVSDVSRGSPDQPSGTLHTPGAKRKRSWSRAVFSNLQRKGLEKRFQLQKYITKPDRRQLAATLGLTDAQVKVWFQNRRMKWRHSKESKHVAGEPGRGREDAGRPDSTQGEDLIDVHTLDS